MKTKKCIRKGDDIQRVHTAVADLKVNEEGYKFIPRHLWKERVRDKKPRFNSPGYGRVELAK